MNYLVTGAVGFIGWRVSEFLLAAGHQVIGVDNLVDTYGLRLKKWRLERLRECRNFEFIKADIATLKELGPCDAIINLAGRAGVRQSVEQPREYFETNVLGVLNLLELCREFGVKKFIQASTSSVYGAGGRFAESTATGKPLSPYAASKKAAETLCYSYHYLHGIDITALRFFTVYGPAGRPDMSLFRFVKLISDGEPLIIYGDGTQSRDFTYIDDIARGVIAGLKPLGYEIINLGGGQPIVLNYAIDLIERLTGKKAERVYRPRHSADVLRTRADNRKAKHLLDWQPQVNFEEGLGRLVEWYNEFTALG